MYFKWIQQFKHNNSIRANEGSMSDCSTPGAALQQFYQYWVVGDVTGWPFDSLSEKEFNARYEAGERMFVVDDSNIKTIVLCDVEFPGEDTSRLSELLIKAELLDEIQVHLHNYLSGFLQKEHLQIASDYLDKAIENNLVLGYKEMSEAMCRIYDEMNI